MAYFAERMWLGIGILLTLGYPLAARGETAGKAVSVSGKVLVRNENSGKVETKFLKPGDDVDGGTVINTDSVGAVKLLLNDKSIIDLGPSTLFKVNHFKTPEGLADRDVSMTMAYGKVRASVNTPVSAKGKYQIRTRSVTMGVRGTEFVVMSDLAAFTAPTLAPEAGKPDAPATLQTQVTVVHGKVVVEDDKAPKEQKPVALLAGDQLTKK